MYLDPLSNSKAKIFPIWNNHKLKHFVPFSSKYEFQIIKFIHLNIFNLFFFYLCIENWNETVDIFKIHATKSVPKQREELALSVCALKT